MLVNEGFVRLLKKILLDSDVNFAVRLFKAGPGAIALTTVIGDLTECDFPGYAAKTAIAFPTPTINGSNEAESDGPDLVWTRGAGAGSQQAKGIYATFEDDTGTTRLLFAEFFTAPVTIDTAGQTVTRSINAFLLQG